MRPQQDDYLAQLADSRQAMERHTVQQAEYEAQLAEGRRLTERHHALMAESEEINVRQMSQLDAMGALIGRWTALADKIEQLVDGRDN